MHKALTFTTASLSNAYSALFERGKLDQIRWTLGKVWSNGLRVGNECFDKKLFFILDVSHYYYIYGVSYSLLPVFEFVMYSNFYLNVGIQFLNLFLKCKQLRNLIRKIGFEIKSWNNALFYCYWWPFLLLEFFHLVLSHTILHKSYNNVDNRLESFWMELKMLVFCSLVVTDLNWKTFFHISRSV